MSSSKVSAKHYVVPQDFFYCIDFFAQPKNRPPTSSTNYAAPKLKLTMDLLALLDAARRKEERVIKWLDALPDKFSRIPGDSRLKVREAQLEQLERERDREMTTRNRMYLTQQLQLQFNNMERTAVVKIGAEEYISLIEPERRELLAYFASESTKVKEQRHKHDTEEQPNRLPAKQFETAENGPRSREHEEMEELYPVEVDLSLDYGPPPPIPPRSLLRPRPSMTTFSEAAPGTTQHADPINAGSSQYSSVVQNDATASGLGSVARDVESGTFRDNPGLVAELRRGMERRRQRERARDEDLEKEREQEISKTTVRGLRFWK